MKITTFLLALALIGLGCSVQDNFTDPRDGNQYTTIELENGQVWMAENLRYQPLPSDGNSWCYDNSESNCTKYGRLYDWKTARSVCPTGWHLPGKAEFEDLNALFVTPSEAFSELIKSGNSGFSALLGGANVRGSVFRDLGSSGYFWSAMPEGRPDAWCLHLDGSNSAADITYYIQTNGFSVRCLQD